MRKQIFSIFEIFTNIIFDRNFLFILSYWLTFCYYLQIRLKYFIAFHSQIDEQTKKQNQILKQYFRNYINYQQNDWIYWLSLTKYAYNNNVYSVIEKHSTKIMYNDYENQSKWKKFIINEKSIDEKNSMRRKFFWIIHWFAREFQSFQIEKKNWKSA